MNSPIPSRGALLPRITLLLCAGLPLATPALAIVNGTDAGNPQFQAVVSLHGCTGTFIHPRFILTAAHCVIRKCSSSSRHRLRHRLPGRGGRWRRRTRWPGLHDCPATGSLLLPAPAIGSISFISPAPPTFSADARPTPLFCEPPPRSPAALSPSFPTRTVRGRTKAITARAGNSPGLPSSVSAPTQVPSMLAVASAAPSLSVTWN